jgi:DNA-binding NtrC family response regulator/tetratricopeptide (TPR) repeat protein
VAALGGLIGNSPGLVAVRSQVEQLLRRQGASGRLPPVLILGETGTGKGLLARAIHESGPRAAGPFVAVNCAAIPETLLEAELFGFERGAFTDARQAKAGLFQTAHRGILFLDEIGLLPENLQAKLLTALEEGAVRRLGSTRVERVDVWIISATSEDLKATPRRHGFREDLYHRLAVVTLRLPPLRERGADILTLAEHFLTRTCREYGLVPKALTADAQRALLVYRWPGNVREVANVMERAALLVDGDLVTVDDLELATPRKRRVSPPEDRETTRGEAPAGVSLGQTVEEIERRHIVEALRETHWNVSRAANRLGVTRDILRYRVQKYGLQPSPMKPELTEPTDGAHREPAPTVGRDPVRVQWERRHVALLRVDLITTAPVVAIPAAVSALEAIVEKIESFGGRVEEMSHEGLLAVFGLEPVEDAPRRAAHAALAIQRIAVLAQPHSEPPRIRIGLHVDDVPIGQIGGVSRVDHAAKRAAWDQLEAFMVGAESGTVLVSEATRPFLERRFVLAPCRAGDGPPRTACRLVGLERTGLGLGERLTPFVARSHELDQVTRALEQAQTGHGQVVAVVGEPGVGKSRLFWEFIESHRDQGSLILVGSSASYGRQTPYLPVIDLLKAYFQVEPRDDTDKVRERVTEKVLTLEPALAPTLPALLALLDVPADDAQWQELDPQQKRRQTLEAVKLLLLEHSRRQPVIVVFEDMHWADSETRAALDTVIESLPSHRVLLLVSYRPEYQHTWGPKTYYAQLRLDPLSPEDAHALLDRLMGRDEATTVLKTVLIERTGGNPFFLEESVRTLVETGVLAGDRGAQRLARPAGEVQVPATVQAVLAARIDRLPPEEKALLHTAAVIGKDVPLALLRSVAEQPEEALRNGLTQLQGSEFLHETKLVPEREYTFKHALSHEVAYAGVLPDRRRALHARILAAIEHLHAHRLTEHVDRLAHHAFRSEVWDKAVTYFRQAGAKAADRSAYREAVACFEQALGALTHLRETRETIEQGIDLRLDLRNSLFALAEFPRVFDCLREAEILADRIGDEGRLGWISAYMAAHFWLANDPDRAVGPGHRALAVAQARGDFALQLVANVRLGQAYLSLGNYPRARECFHRTIDSLAGDLIYKRFGDAWLPSVAARVWFVYVLAKCGEFAEGIATGEEAVRIAEAVNEGRSVIHAYRSLGHLYLRKGDLEEAISHLERCHSLGQAWKIPTFPLGVPSYLGYAYILSGRLADGVQLLERHIEQTGSINLGQARTFPVIHLSEGYLRANRIEDAIRLAGQARDFARNHKLRAHEAWALRTLGEIAARRDPAVTEGAETYYRQALGLAEELGMRPMVAHCHLGLGKLYRRVGKCDEASEHLASATRMYREMDMRFWLAQAEAEAGRL